MRTTLFLIHRRDPVSVLNLAHNVFEAQSGNLAERIENKFNVQIKLCFQTTPDERLLDI